MGSSFRSLVCLSALTLVLGCSRDKADEDEATRLSAAAPRPSSAPSAASSSEGLEPAEEPDPIAEQPEEAPLVDLAGVARPAALSVVRPGPRVYAKAMRVWVYQKPTRKSRRLGYLRAGASSPTSAEPAGHDDCAKGWFPVEPGGFVCVGRRATLDGKDPIVLATQEYRPDHMRKLPYIYGTVRRPGPIYRRLPSGEELRKAESDVDDRMKAWLEADGEIGASYAQDVWLGGEGEVPDPAKAWEDKLTDSVPEYLRNGGMAPNLLHFKGDLSALSIEHMRPKVGYSFLRTFFWEGRRYGVTTGLRVMPTDRLRPIQGSDLHGVRIPEDIDFPFALVRKPFAHFYLFKKENGRLVKYEKAPYGGAVKLTGKQRFFNKVLHYETKDGYWLSDREASRIEPAKKMPRWGSEGSKWIDVNLTLQRLVLYEGTKPVFATLISSGEAGLEDHKTSTATKRGIFRIHTKHITTTMSSDEVGEEFELRDVPYVQYFEEGYALHAAYWHDRFGTPKSHGCINLAPEDARRIFYWTEPHVPRGWHGALLPLKGTIIFVHP
ncbi:MAG: L,D-transpeptidase [Polyangiaceae bacterium]